MATAFKCIGFLFVCLIAYIDPEIILRKFADDKTPNYAFLAGMAYMFVLNLLVDLFWRKAWDGPHAD